MGDSTHYLDYLKNSRELALGSLIRQSLPFRIFRHIRLSHIRVEVEVLGKSNPHAQASEVNLLGIWSEEYPYGMPLEFLEHNPKKWQTIERDSSPFGKALVTSQKEKISVYSQHENLRLDFRCDQNSGIVKIKANGFTKIIDLFTPEPGVASVFPNQDNINFVNHSNIPSLEYGSPLSTNVPISKKISEFLQKDLLWLEQQSEPMPLSLNNPVWLGILSSAQELFRNLYLLPDNLDSEKARYYAHLFVEASVPSIIIQGFPSTYGHLVKALRRIAPHLPIFVIYHGNFAQLREDYEWFSFKMILDLYSKGDISKVGFVKEGMAETMQRAGVHSSFIMNFVRRIPSKPSDPDENGIHIGIWGQPDWGWRKSPYAMLAALQEIPGAVGHAYNVSSRAIEFSRLISLKMIDVNTSIPREKVLAKMSKMHLNLNVTFSECAPMLPLESFSVGTPCLIGPTTHYFIDNEFLHSHVVISQPDNSRLIAEKANQVLAERKQIIAAYRIYAEEYNRRALDALTEFLESPAS